ncbi:hypothetical protein [Deinococcus sp.]|uniref:hypothetical protein n=1 Tax=Deinococcus sp. TaxID=47478 RepID=UPI003B5AC80C
MFILLPLLLLATVPPHNPPPVATVTLGNGKTVTVVGPGPVQWADIVVDWELSNLAYSPDHKFAAVQFTFSVAKGYNSAIYLVRPDGSTFRLASDTVFSIEWTSDSKYILGFGGNTLRLWNLNGGLKQLTVSSIDKHNLVGNKIYLEVPTFGSDGCQNGEWLRAYSIPSLKQLSSAPVPFTKNEGCGIQR